MCIQLSETSTSGFVLNSKGDLDQLAALCERSRKMFTCFPSWFLCPYHRYYYCKIETKCDPTKLIKILNIFYKHGISCVLVIVHRILREYQNWTEFKLTPKWSCENKLYLQSIRMLYKQRPRKIKLVLRSISWITIHQCSVLMSKIRREILCW